MAPGKYPKRNSTQNMCKIGVQGCSSACVNPNPVSPFRAEAGCGCWLIDVRLLARHPNRRTLNNSFLVLRGAARATTVPRLPYGHHGRVGASHDGPGQGSCFVRLSPEGSHVGAAYRQRLSGACEWVCGWLGLCGVGGFRARRRDAATPPLGSRLVLPDTQPTRQVPVRLGPSSPLGNTPEVSFTFPSFFIHSFAHLLSAKGSTLRPYQTLSHLLPLAIANVLSPTMSDAPNTGLVIAGTAIATTVVISLLHRYLWPTPPAIARSPLKTLLPTLSAEEYHKLEYKPDNFPGARDVETPVSQTHALSHPPR